MRTNYSSPLFALISLCVVALVLGALFIETPFDNFQIVLGEEGLLEDLQEIVLLLATILFFTAAVYQQGPDRMFVVGMGILCALFFFREWSFEPIGAISYYINSKEFRWHEAVAVIIIAGIYALLRPHYILPIIKFVLSPKAWLFYVAVLLLVASHLYENYSSSVYYEYYEEMLELSGYLVVLMLAIRANSARPVSSNQTSL